MTQQQPTEQKSQRSLAHMPVTLFASVMGVGALSLAYKRAAAMWEAMPEWPHLVLLGLAALLFVVILGAYVAKWAAHPKAARAELTHPIRMPFVPTLTISLLILATSGADVAPTLASVLWWIGAVGHLVATALVITVWFNSPNVTAGIVTPAWVIPVVGNVVTPLAARQVGNVDLAWFAFGIGLLLWLGLLPLLLHRLLLAENPLPPKLMPTIAIMIAPPAVMTVSWVQLTDDPAGIVTRLFAGVTWMFTAIVALQLPRFLKMGYVLTFLSFTFPLGALAVATLIMAGALEGVFYDVLAAAVLAIVTVVILGVVARTIVAAAKGAIFLPEK